MSGRQYLQIPGPTNVPERVIRAMAVPMINQRGPEYAKLVQDCVGGLKQVFATTGEILWFPSSGSGGLESTIVNTLSPGDKILSVSQGVFSERFAKIAEAHGVLVERIEVEWGKAVDPQEIFKRLRADTGRSIKAVTVDQNETATGVLNDIRTIGLGIKETGHPALLFVDAVSALAMAEIRPDEWGVDVVIAASQKGLMLPPGLAILAIGPRAWQACETSRMPKWYWDWKQMKKAMDAGGSAYTPPTGILFGLRESLAMLNEEGLANVFVRHQRLARATRAAIRGMGLSVLPAEEVASPTLTAINVPAGIEWKALSKLMREKYRVVLGGGLGKLEGKIFRIGHMGEIYEPELLAVLGCLELGLAELGADIRLGEGFKAAQRLFLEPYGSK
ncbi:MAG: pyridoxal-phosphate-dependent aminotransferase family protein [Mycobacterium leprae]